MPDKCQSDTITISGKAIYRLVNRGPNSDVGKCIVTVYMCVFVHLCSPIGHDDVIKWKHFLRKWPFVRGIHRSPASSPHKGQWRGALMVSLIYVWINDWVNNRKACDLRRYRAHYDVIVMVYARLSNEYWHVIRRGFKNAYELLNRRALQFSTLSKISSFLCVGNVLVEFQREPLKFHTQHILPINWKIWS